MVASSSEITIPDPATATLKSAVILKDSRYSVFLNRSLKLSNQTKVLTFPNASCTRNEYHTACAAGQKKKITVTAICGASSAYGSHFESKTTRFSIHFPAPPR